MHQHLQFQGTSILNLFLFFFFAISALAVVKYIDGKFSQNFRQLFITWLCCLPVAMINHFRNFVGDKILVSSSAWDFKFYYILLGCFAYTFSVGLLLPFFVIVEVVKLSVFKCKCEFKVVRTTSKRNQ